MTLSMAATATAFTIPSITTTPTLSTTTTTPTPTGRNNPIQRHMPCFTASVDEDVEKIRNEDNGRNGGEGEANWMSELDSKEVQEVRNELIQKYLSLGRTMEYAEMEVDKFLSDPERSSQFLEMRRYAKANNDLGFEFIFQLGGAFLLGLSGNVAVKYFAAYKDVYPDGSGPIPFV